MKTILLLTFAVFSFGLFAQDYSKGFKDMDWGTKLSEVSDQFTKSDNKIPPLKGYDKNDEDLSFEGFMAELITYGFKKEALKGVNIVIKDEKLDELVQLWTERYGDPKVTEAGFLKNFEWHKDKFRLTISHFPNKAGDANTTIGIAAK